MIYEHTIMFRLTTPRAIIDKVIADTEVAIKQPLSNLLQEKRRIRVRDCGTKMVHVVAFEFEGDAVLMEQMRDQLWEDHEDILSTLTIPHQTAGYDAPPIDLTDEIIHDTVFEDEEDADEEVVEEVTPAGAERFSKDALLRRFENVHKTKRTIVRPIVR